MRILIHTDEYFPTAQACAFRMSVLADAFLSRGHEVTVIASSANKKAVETGTRPERIFYAPTIPMKKKTAIMRMLNNLSFGLTSVFTAIRAGKTDVVITTSPPPLVSISGWLIAKCKRARLVYDVRDIWPDVALEMGTFTVDSFYCKVFRAITDFMYRHADWVLTVSPGKLEKVRQHVLSAAGKKATPAMADKVKLVGNGFDERILSTGLDQDLAKKYHLDEGFTCVYIGNIGLAQGLGSLLQIAEQTRHKDVQFLLFGMGAERGKLEEEARARGLDNVHFCGVLPHEQVFTLLSCAKLSFIPLKSASMKDSIPTKVYEALGVGCPVLLFAEGDACDLVRETQMGRCVSPDHPEQLTPAFEEMVEHYSDYLSHQAEARRIMRGKYSRQQMALQFEAELCSLTGQRSKKNG